MISFEMQIYKKYSIFCLLDKLPLLLLKIYLTYIMKEKLVTLAIHTLGEAVQLQKKLEKEGIQAFIRKIRNLSVGVRVRIKEADLPLALAFIERLRTEKENQKNAKKFILVPFDFSDYSLKASRVAFHLAGKLNVSIVFLYVYLGPEANSFSVLLSSEETEKAQKELSNKIINDIYNIEDQFRSEINQKDLPDISFSFITRSGIPEDEILDYSNETNPLLIVMGTRGKSKKEKDLIGSVTAEVIEKSMIPVFAIPEDSSLRDFDGLKHIAYATNFGQKDLAAFAKLMCFIKDMHFDLTFIHVITEQEEELNEEKLNNLKDYFKKQYPQLCINFKIIQGNKSLLKELDKYIMENNVNTLVIRSNKRNMFARLFAPSIARKMIFHAKTPLFVLN